jgi:flagellin
MRVAPFSVNKKFTGARRPTGSPQNGERIMTTSVNTNVGAMVALQNLTKTTMELEGVRNRISTGLKVAGAKDDGGVFAIAQSMRASVGALKAVKGSLNRGLSTTDIALSAGEAVSDLLVEMKAKALAGSDASMDTQSRTALNEDFKALRKQIATIVNNASFNGVNLIDGSTNAFVALANEDGSSVITVQAEDLSFAGGIVTIATTASFATATEAGDIASQIGTSLDQLNLALARLGTASKSLGVHSTFVTKLSDEFEKGIGNLVDADLAREGARLQALQVKEQLGMQALAIANQAPQTLLSLFQ